MTFMAILVWLVIVAGTAFMLKMLIFPNGLKFGKGCCSAASAGAAGDDGSTAKDFSCDAFSAGEAVKEEPAEEKKEPEGEEK